jgi:diaminohydroxyphosphoribosylaminopyrimidine deaminase/5-amino-6-(5-phosphoribosylamino)uracil reductase
MKLTGSNPQPPSVAINNANGVPRRMFTALDHQHMAQALRLARLGLLSTRPNPAVGCVIARGAEVVAEGWHKKAGGPHAEVHALQMAGAQARGATVYVTLEPCSHTGKTGPCADALINAGVSRVVAAIEDANPEVAGRGLAKLAAAGIEVASGLLQAEAEQINAGFFQRMRTGQPRLLTKIAASLDGRTAMASGESKWITGPAARADVQRTRAAACAVVTGINTVLADDPQLNVRDEALCEALPSQPLRVVLDSRLQMPENAAMLKTAGRVILLTTTSGLQEAATKAEKLRAAGAEVVDLGAELTPLAVLQWLGEQQCNNVMLEAGARLNGAFLAAGCVDELRLYQAAHVMGAAARGLFDIPDLQAMQDRFNFRLADVRQLGDDLRLTYLPQTQK